VAEWKCFVDEVAHVSTFEFHEHRERAPHLEQPIHHGRLMMALDFAKRVHHPSYTQYVDLGCGDGGLVSELRRHELDAYGVDFQPTNVAGWHERNIRGFCTAMNFVEEWHRVPHADVYIATEVLEHLTDPHDMLAKIRARGAKLVCSSPWDETFESHDACHAWAWDMEGYAKLVTDAGFRVVAHEKTYRFQVILAEPQ
jgi:2-polyprenyl-3-methyl-5-hydroxy-6-metoxy-1,4-benzoquinol methylase